MSRSDGGLSPQARSRLDYLAGFFRGWRVSRIGPADIATYVVHRQGQKTELGTLPSNRTINIELALLKRMLRLGYKQGKVVRVPPIEILREAPARTGFFEAGAYDTVRRRLRADLVVAISIAHTYGWRVRSKVLMLRRRPVDLEFGTLRLDPGMTQNGEGRLVHLTPELRRLLREQLARVDLRDAPARLMGTSFGHVGRGRRLTSRKRAESLTT
jgi:hypothetical protein